MNYERLIANCDTMIGWGHYYKSAGQSTFGHAQRMRCC